VIDLGDQLKYVFFLPSLAFSLKVCTLSDVFQIFILACDYQYDWRLKY